jgi:hypothetical protein
VHAHSQVRRVVDKAKGGVSGSTTLPPTTCSSKFCAGLASSRLTGAGARLLQFRQWIFSSNCVVPTTEVLNLRISAQFAKALTTFAQILEQGV